MNADKTIKQLRYMATNCDRTNIGCQWGSVCLDGANLIERLSPDAASYRQIKKALQSEGFEDLDTMISRYKQVMADANEIAISKDEQIEQLQSALAASQLREQAAVALLVKAGFCSQEPLYECDEERPAACHACITKWCLNGPQEGGIHEA